MVRNHHRSPPYRNNIKCCIHFSDDESKKSNENVKQKSLATEVTKEINGQTFKLDFSSCIEKLKNSKKPKKKPVVAISSGESDDNSPATKVKEKKKRRIIRSSSDESEVNMITDRPATPPTRKNIRQKSNRQIQLIDSDDSMDLVPVVNLSKGINRTRQQPITIPDIDKLKEDDVQIVDSCDSMKEFDSREAMMNGKPRRKQISPDIILGRSKTTSRRITDKTMECDYVAPVLPRFKKKKQPKKADEIMDQFVIPPINPLIEPSIPEMDPNISTAGKLNTKQNTKMGCLDTLAQMEESSDDNILQGWGPENSQSIFVAGSSRSTRLDGPSRSKRLSKDLQSTSKRPRRDKPHPVYDAFRKSVRSPDLNKRDAFVSPFSNKVRFDGGRHPKQRSRTEKENYEKRYSANSFRTRDTSPDDIVEIFSSAEKKSKNMTERNKSHHQKQNVLQLSSDTE